MILPADVEAYERLLKCTDDIDYVGTRFHGGVFAMRHLKRALLITLDERMTAMQNRIPNNYIAREDIDRLLTRKIQSEFETVVNIDVTAISKWKEQFR